MLIKDGRGDWGVCVGRWIHSKGVQIFNRTVTFEIIWFKIDTIIVSITRNTFTSNKSYLKMDISIFQFNNSSNNLIVIIVYNYEY